MPTEAQRGKWYGPWCSFLVSLLDERKLNPSDFAALVGDRQNNVWQYLRGIIRPPLKKLDLWARRLKLDDAERAKFIRMARLAHAPQEIRDEIESLRNAQAATAAQLAATRKVLQDLGVDVSGLGKL
jgi:transcriptional regulator with XRE-family HTH domain